LAGGDSTPLERTEACSDDRAALEPDTASVSCFCTSDLNPDLKTSAFDTASFQCQTPALRVEKVCEEQDAQGVNAITVTVTNTGDTDLENCVATDTVDSTNVTLSPQPFNLAANGGQQILTGSVSGLTQDTNNTVTVTCGVVGDGTISGTASDVCEVRGRGCLSRTPGFWCTHPNITAQFLPLDSCGLTLNTVTAGIAVSATEDLTFSGKDFKNNNTSPQQLQLIRQCAAANLNVAATLTGGGDCESEFPTLGALLDRCCNGPDPVCNSDSSPNEIGTSQCIELLDEFNNSLDTIAPFGPFVRPGPANPRQCQAANGNGFVNPGRDLGPAK
jgi:hypothetical protein